MTADRSYLGRSFCFIKDNFLEGSPLNTRPFWGPQMNTKSLAFNDIVSHASALDAWSQYYDQLSPGRFEGWLQDLQLPGGLRIFRERMSSRVAQHTLPPPDTVNLLIPLCLRSEPDPESHALLPDALTLLPLASEFFFCTPPDTDYVVVSMDLSMLERLLTPQDLELFLKRPRGYALRSQPAPLAGLRRWCVRLLEVAHAEAQPPSSTDLSPLIRDEIVYRLLEGLDGSTAFGVRRSRLRTLDSSHSYLVRYCHEKVLDTPEPIGVLGLCRELKVPRRTLAYAFERVTGMPPTQYLRAVRLNAADRSLHQDATCNLGDLSYTLGFTHASHFGREYKKLFGRTPSECRATQGAARPRFDH